MGINYRYPDALSHGMVFALAAPFPLGGAREARPDLLIQLAPGLLAESDGNIPRSVWERREMGPSISLPIHPSIHP